MLVIRYFTRIESGNDNGTAEFREENKFAMKIPLASERRETRYYYCQAPWKNEPFSVPRPFDLHT